MEPLGVGLVAKIVTITNGVFNIVWKIVIEYKELHKESKRERAKIRQITALESAHREELASQEIEYKRKTLAIEKASKERESRIAFSVKLKKLLLSYGFISESDSLGNKNDKLEFLSKFLSNKNDYDIMQAIRELNLASDDYSTDSSNIYYSRGDYCHYTFCFCRKCNNLANVNGYCKFC